LVSVKISGSHHHAEPPQHQIHHPQHRIRRPPCRRGKRERKQRTCCRCRRHRIVDLAAMSWIWPEEKGSRLAVDPARGEEGRPSRSRFGRGRRRAATPSSIWPGEKKGGHPIGRRLGFWLAAMSSCTMPDPRHRGPSREQGDLSAGEGREGELALGTEEQGRRRRRQSAGRRS